MKKLLIGGSSCTHWSIAKQRGRETEASGLGWDLFMNYVKAKELFNTFNALNAFADFSQLREELYAEGDAVSADGWKDRSGNH